MVDVRSAGCKISGELLAFIYRLKTGALIEASVMIGAVLAGAKEEENRKNGRNRRENRTGIPNTRRYS